MKRFNIFTVLLIGACMAFVSCGANTPEVEPEFWELNSSFDAPSDWETYSYAGAFSIQIPAYMKEQQSEGVINEEKLRNGEEHFIEVSENTLSGTPLQPGGMAEMTFSARNDSLHNAYARILVRYVKGNKGDFLDYLDSPSLDTPEANEFCDQLIKGQLGSGTLIKVLHKGFVMTSKTNMVLDICYQRVGHTEEEGPVTVHIFYMQHTDEAVFMTVSYHDKNKDMFKDLYNIVETLEWSQYKNSKSSIN